MIDFLMVSTRSAKRGVIEIYPKFIIKKSSDLMIRGGDFYAIWIEERGLWSTDEQDALQLIDRELDRYAKEHEGEYEDRVKVLHMWDAENRMIDSWHRYCQRDMRDNFHMLDEKLIFSNTEVGKKDYASKRLNYPLEAGSMEAYDRLMSVLYAPEERHKIEWAIGAVVSGDSKKLQKFLVFYGSAGTGKSTVLNIIQQLFEGYYSVFDAKALGSSSNVFALEAFRNNPLVAIQHDGDLSRIEDNTRINSLVSHEIMTVNEKFKSTYSTRFKAFLFMGTNKPVKITDAKSGLIRRLIDVSPTGDKLSAKEYRTVTRKIEFELGAIAKHCLEVYEEDPGFYDAYIPVDMLGASNDFYNFVMDSFYIFKREDGTTMKAAWEMYKTYCDEARVPYQMSQRNFREELKNYFREYEDRHTCEDGSRVRSYYSGFREDKFEEAAEPEETPAYKIEMDSTVSVFDTLCADAPAQYASERETPQRKWTDVTTKLKDIDTTRLHYVKVPDNHIVIDFDIPDENGEKSLEKNLREASKWPPTYAELSKSGKGVHLHYIYSGDPEKLARVYADHVEIKAFTGNSSLRRKLTLCNALAVATISSGLPLKGEKPVVNFEAVKNEKMLRKRIEKGLKKEVWPNTKPSVDYIYKVIEDAYSSGVHYDISDMHNVILAFAAQSTNQKEYCIKLVGKMHFKSEDASDWVDNSTAPIVFFDVEVFPNLFVVVWKLQGKENQCVKLINPDSEEIQKLLAYRLIGFNNRRYDNHILYGRLIGYDNEALYDLSQRLVSKKSKSAFFGEAYNLSYTDIYDFSSEKKSLKKFEIELGIHHQELGLPWDKPVPEELWPKVAAYCVNDVIATEAVFDARQGDFRAREILAEIAGMSVNDTTNTLTTRIIFGGNRKPQSVFNYRDLSKPVRPSEDFFRRYGDPSERTYRIFDAEGTPTYREYIPGDELPEGYSIMPFFPGYQHKLGKSTYLGQEIGEGGRVYSEPGMYAYVWDEDVSSQHPYSGWEERAFGPEYTQRFKDLIDIRILIKHKEFGKARKLLNGALAKYLDDETVAKELAQALKIAINSVYGLTSAKFDNAFRDPRNVDNIVAKRGALFMTKLKEEVQKRGYTVCHIKTDSIKVPNAGEDIVQFIIDFGREYGYSFETEAVFDKFCLVNDAVYIAKERGGGWTATGAQFQVPYVFKTLFTHENITFSDLCETKSVTSALYLDMNESLPEGEHDYRFVGRVGQFCPMKQDCGGGLLLRDAGEGKYSSATGAKGYRWMESEKVKELGLEDCIDRSYYDRLVDAAVKDISKYGDFEWFVSDDTEPPNDFPPEDELPWYSDEELKQKFEKENVS